MICAYDKVYLEKARTALARMFDFVVYDLHFDIAEFFNLFITSGAAKKFERGDYEILAGMSGVELAYKVLELSSVSYKRIKPQYTMNRSKEYWAGWALAYYQWKTSLSFSEINRAVPIEDVVALYSPYHEMDILHFCNKMNELFKKANPETNLKKHRTNANISQRQLAEFSGVPLRTIQQYEQRQKNINKAQAEYLFALAKALHCDIEDLLEKLQSPNKSTL